LPVVTGSKELDQLVAQFKRGYTLERTSGGHYRVRDRQGKFVEINGKTLSLSGTAHGGRILQNMRAQLKSAGVLQGTAVRKPARKTAKNPGPGLEKMREANAARDRRRSLEAKALFKRFETTLKPVGGVTARGVTSDLGYIGAMFAREQGLPDATPDLYTQSAYRMLHEGGQWVDPKYSAIWRKLAEELENATDVSERYFELVRKARGLPEEIIVVGKPAEGDWPFEVKLLPIEALLIDHDYQRPPDWAFVRKTARTFDESLVGTIDVAERRRGALFAVLDGQQRYEMCRLVGKKTIWASVYRGLDKMSEARFFLHKNKDKKAIHPFYTFRARMAAGDDVAIELNRIAIKLGYRLTFQSANEAHPEQISAISALEETHGRKLPDGREALTPTLSVLKQSTWGMHHGQNHVLLRALGIVFQEKGDKIDEGRLAGVLRAATPEMLLNRAREDARYSSANTNTAYAMARLIVGDYDRGLRSSKDKLGKL
jgi:hypothetical protein